MRWTPVLERHISKSGPALLTQVQQDSGGQPGLGLHNPGETPFLPSLVRPPHLVHLVKPTWNPYSFSGKPSLPACVYNLTFLRTPESLRFPSIEPLLSAKSCLWRRYVLLVFRPPHLRECHMSQYMDGEAEAQRGKAACPGNL